MTSLAIRAERLGKQYQIGAAQHRPQSLREAIVRAAVAPLANLRRLRASGRRNGSSADLVWAVRDISFEVRQGEVVGIIGRNGAGKSTLLKLLSRITEPTTGCADLYGRVGCLLEVGTGFHQELTGRDNIYLSGSILGMDRGYIRRRFDEIVEFAGIGMFLDTPVKKYSSGMYLRLAFAVAAHLEPEVLMVDEVLAVGDAEFQKKCLGKMGSVAREGRTVLFVSHDMNAVRRLCPRTILLDGGRVSADGNTFDLIQRYLAPSASSGRPGMRIDLSGAPRVMGSGEARVESVEYRSDREDLGGRAYPDGPLTFDLSLSSEARRTLGSLGVTIYDQHGTKLVNADTLLIGGTLNLEPGMNRTRLRIESVHLRPGVYRVGFWLSDPVAREVFDCIDSAFELEVCDLQGHSLGSRTTGPDGVVTCRFGVEGAVESAR
jgi:lipopolysaccharide transport system ATP-binding protein